MGFIKHLVYTIIILLAGSIMLHFFGLPTPFELLKIFVRVFSVPAG
ncbi:MAG: hypothetical protein HY366_02840 [Candidatus Aenigmarchaeota archaeon]|nr:hypothetical protein [Candidatus Aenigmarchaeota archaeon]